MNPILKNIKEGDYIAFEFQYNADDRKSIEVAKISHVYEHDVLVTFLYGYKSVSEHVKFHDIIAVGDLENGEKIPHWGGKFQILKPHHPTLISEYYGDIRIGDTILVKPTGWKDNNKFVSKVNKIHYANGEGDNIYYINFGENDAEIIKSEIIGVSTEKYYKKEGEFILLQTEK